MFLGHRAKRKISSLRLLHSGKTGAARRVRLPLFTKPKKAFSFCNGRNTRRGLAHVKKHCTINFAERKRQGLQTRQNEAVRALLKGDCRPLGKKTCGCQLNGKATQSDFAESLLLKKPCNPLLPAYKKYRKRAVVPLSFSVFLRCLLFNSATARRLHGGGC